MLTTPYSRAGVEAGGSIRGGGSGNKIVNKSKKKYRYDYNKYTQAFRNLHSTESPQTQSRSVEVVDTQTVRERGYRSNKKTWNSDINSNNNSINSKKALKQQQIFGFGQRNTQSESDHQVQLSGDSHNSHDSHSFKDSTKLTIPPILLQNNASNGSNTSDVSFDAITKEPNGMSICSAGSFNGVFPNNTQKGSGSGSGSGS